MKKKLPKKNRTPHHLSIILSSITPSRVLWWKVSGVFYGYPQCCIEAFCRLDHIREEAETGKRALASDMGKSTGFIPCRICAEKLHKGEVKLNDLISARKSPKVFPRCSDKDVDLIYEMISV